MRLSPLTAILCVWRTERRRAGRQRRTASPPFFPPSRAGGRRNLPTTLPAGARSNPALALSSWLHEQTTRASRCERPIEGDQGSFGRLSKRQEPCIHPHFGRGCSGGGVLAEAGFHLGRFWNERGAVVLEKAVEDLPSRCHAQRLAVHGRGGRHQAQETE